MSEGKKERDPFMRVLQLMGVALCLPLAPFILGTLTEATLWRALLSRVPGITFIGGFFEAICLSLVCSATIFLCLAAYRLVKVVYLKSQGKSTEGRDNVPLERAREELQKAKRPSFKPALVRFCLMSITLYFLSQIAPDRLGFDSPICLLGVSFLMTVVFYLFMSIVLAFTQSFVAWFEKNGPKSKEG